MNPHDREAETYDAMTSPLHGRSGAVFNRTVCGLPITARSRRRVIAVGRRGDTTRAQITCALCLARIEKRP